MLFYLVYFTVGYGVTANIAASQVNHTRTRQLGVRLPVSESAFCHLFYLGLSSRYNISPSQEPSLVVAFKEGVSIMLVR